MIYPQTLYNFAKSCKDSKMVGNVLRALCKQGVELNDNERMMLEMIQNDNSWMDERMEAKRERMAERQRKSREKSIAVHGDSQPEAESNVTLCHTQECDNTLVTREGVTTRVSHAKASVTREGVTTRVSRPLPSFLPSSLPTSLPSVNNNNRSVTVTVAANGTETGTEREIEVEKMSGGIKEAQKRGVAFVAAVKRDQGAFFDPEHDAVTICACVTADWKSLKRWRQLVAAKGEDAVRQETFAFWREINAGEDVDNRGATLNKRLGALRDQPKEN